MGTTVQAYAIRKVGWQYNDENYYIEGSGDIEAIFVNKEKAEKICAEKNFEHMTDKYFDPIPYMDRGIKGIINKSFSKAECLERLRKLYSGKNIIISSIDDFEENMYNYYDSKYSEDEIKQFMELFPGLKFYEVVTVTLDMDLGI